MGRLYHDAARFVSDTIYAGLPLPCINVLPTYSPIMPSISSVIAPIIEIRITMDVHPDTAVPFTKRVYNAYIISIEQSMDSKADSTIDRRRGRMEKAVSPFKENNTILFSVYLVSPDCRLSA